MNTGVLPTATHRYQTNPRRMVFEAGKGKPSLFLPTLLSGWRDVFPFVCVGDWRIR